MVGLTYGFRGCFEAEVSTPFSSCRSALACQAMPKFTTRNQDVQIVCNLSVQQTGCALNKGIDSPRGLIMDEGLDVRLEPAREDEVEMSRVFEYTLPFVVEEVDVYRCTRSI